MNAYEYEVFHDAVAYMEQNVGKTMHVADIARAIHVSESRLQRSFRACAAVSVHAYLLRSKLERAMGYLKNGQSVEAAAAAAGFSGRNHFSTCFKKHFGLSPTQVRKAAK